MHRGFGVEGFFVTECDRRSRHQYQLVVKSAPSEMSNPTHVVGTDLSIHHKPVELENVHSPSQERIVVVVKGGATRNGTLQPSSSGTAVPGVKRGMMMSRNERESKGTAREGLTQLSGEKKQKKKKSVFCRKPKKAIAS